MRKNDSGFVTDQNQTAARARLTSALARLAVFGTFRGRPDFGLNTRRKIAAEGSHAIFPSRHRAVIGQASHGDSDESHTIGTDSTAVAACTNVIPPIQDIDDRIRRQAQRFRDVPGQ